jgi:hypothetical protein
LSASRSAGSMDPPKNTSVLLWLEGGLRHQAGIHRNVSKWVESGQAVKARSNLATRQSAIGHSGSSGTAASERSCSIGSSDPPSVILRWNLTCPHARRRGWLTAPHKLQGPARERYPIHNRTAGPWQLMRWLGGRWHVMERAREVRPAGCPEARQRRSASGSPDRSTAARRGEAGMRRTHQTPLATLSSTRSLRASLSTKAASRPWGTVSRN